MTEDAYPWLEEVDGEEALAWVRERNGEKAAELAAGATVAGLAAAARAAIAQWWCRLRLRTPDQPGHGHGRLHPVGPRHRQRRQDAARLGWAGD